MAHNSQTQTEQTQTIDHDGYTFERDLLTQLYAVRDTGATNMVNIYGVRDVANQCEFDDLVDFCDDSRRDGARYMAALEAMADTFVR